MIEFFESPQSSETIIFQSMEALHVSSDDNGNVVLAQGSNKIVFPQTLAGDFSFFVLEAGRGDR